MYYKHKHPTYKPYEQARFNRITYLKYLNNLIDNLFIYYTIYLFKYVNNLSFKPS